MTGVSPATNTSSADGIRGLSQLRAKMMTSGGAYWSYDPSVGAWYFGLEERVSPPYLTQRRVTAILDLDAQGRLAGVEILESLEPSIKETYPSPSFMAGHLGENQVKDHWSVTVTRNGEDVVTIESNCLSGREISPEDEAVISTAAHHLLAFIGGKQERLGYEFEKVLAEGSANGNLYVRS